MAKNSKLFSPIFLLEWWVGGTLLFVLRIWNRVESVDGAENHALEPQMGTATTLALPTDTGGDDENFDEPSAAWKLLVASAQSVTGEDPSEQHSASYLADLVMQGLGHSSERDGAGSLISLDTLQHFREGFEVIPEEVARLDGSKDTGGEASSSAGVRLMSESFGNRKT